MPTTLRAALAMLIVMGGGPVRADSPPVPRVVDSVGGGQVTAEVERYPDGVHRVTVRGIEVLVDDLSMAVVLRGIHEAGGRSYVLLEQGSGGTACPSVFVAVDASADPPAVTRSFGNCSDLPRVSTKEDALVVTMPDRHGFLDAYEIRGNEVVESRVN